MKVKLPNLFICRSPLQLLNCTEACEHFGLRDEYTILMCAWRAERDKEMMANILDMYPHWSEVHFFPLYPTSGQWNILRNIFGRHKKFSHLFVGDTTHLINFFINKIGNFDEIYWVDDGTATHHRIRQISEKQLHMQRKNFSFRPAWQTLILNKIGMLPTFAYGSKFFTIYKSPQHSTKNFITKNELSFIKSKISQKPTSDEIWFIGSNIRNEVLLNPLEYTNLMQKISEITDLKNVTYIPHRKESDKYLEDLASELGFKVLRFKNIIEVELTTINRLPKKIISMGSSAIDTITQLTSIPITLFKVPTNYCTPIRKESMENMYKESKDKNIEIIYL